MTCVQIALKSCSPKRGTRQFKPGIDPTLSSATIQYYARIIITTTTIVAFTDQLDPAKKTPIKISFNTKYKRSDKMILSYKHKNS